MLAAYMWKDFFLKGVQYLCMAFGYLCQGLFAFSQDQDYCLELGFSLL